MIKFNESSDVSSITCLKYIIVGPSGVGKTSIANQFTKNKFSDIFNSTVGVDFLLKKVSLNDKTFKITFWDTAGQEKYQLMTKNLYRQSNCCFFVFDVTNRKTFLEINNLYNNFISSIDNECFFYLIGNKIDLANRQVSFDEAQSYANKKNIKYIEVSAKSNINIQKCFIESLNYFLDDSNKEINTENSSLLNKKTRFCCLLF